MVSFLFQLGGRAPPFLSSLPLTSELLISWSFKPLLRKLNSDWPKCYKWGHSTCIFCMNLSAGNSTFQQFASHAQELPKNTWVRPCWLKFCVQVTKSTYIWGMFAYCFCYVKKLVRSSFRLYKQQGIPATRYGRIMLYCSQGIWDKPL